MDGGDIAGLLAVLVFAVLVGLLALPIVKLGRVFDELRLTIRSINDGTTPLIDEVTRTVTTTNTQLEKVDGITSNVSDASANVSALSSLVASTVGQPLIKVASFSHGLRRAFSPQPGRRAQRAPPGSRDPSRPRTVLPAPGASGGPADHTGHEPSADGSGPRTPGADHGNVVQTRPARRRRPGGRRGHPRRLRSRGPAVPVPGHPGDSREHGRGARAARGRGAPRPTRRGGHPAHRGPALRRVHGTGPGGHGGARGAAAAAVRRALSRGPHRQPPGGARRRRAPAGVPWHPVTSHDSSTDPEDPRARVIEHTPSEGNER